VNKVAPGIIAGVLAAGAAISIAAHHPALGAFLNNPDTATTLTSIVVGILGIVAGVLKGYEQQ
jgi:hypothetical protein